MTPAQQTTFDLLKLAIAAVFGFVFGISGNLIVYYLINRERRLRLLEREGKRHKFWKDFFDTQAALPMQARCSAQEIDAVTIICKAELARSFEEIIGHAKLANSTAMGIAALASLLFVFFLEYAGNGFVAKWLTLGLAPGASTFESFIATLTLFWVLFAAVYKVVYSPTKELVKKWMLDFQRRKALIKP